MSKVVSFYGILQPHVRFGFVVINVIPKNYRQSSKRHPLLKPSSLGPLHNTITRYKFCHAGWQTAHWEFQNRDILSLSVYNCFLLEVPVRNLPSSMADLIRCDVIVLCKGPIHNHQQLFIENSPTGLPRAFQSLRTKSRQLPEIWAFMLYSFFKPDLYTTAHLCLYLFLNLRVWFSLSGLLFLTVTLTLLQSVL